MPLESVIHSSFDGRDIERTSKKITAIFAAGFDMAEVRDLAKLGIRLDTRMIARMFHESASFGMDTIQQPLTTASIPTLVQFLQNWLPGFVKIITAARKGDEIFGKSTVGSWEDEEIVQPVLENTGTATPYGDVTNTQYSNWNLNFNSRTIVRFESGMRVGSLEEARAARVRVNSGETKRESAALMLEQARNAICFYGYNSGDNNTYGALNDPNLPNYVQVATGALGYNWSVKTFLEITADIRNAIVALRTNSQDTIDPETTNLTLAIATNCVDYLTVVSDFGVSVRDWIKQTYPKVRVTSCPQFENAHSGDNVFYLFADTVNDTSSTDDARTFLQVVPQQFMILGVQKLTKGYEEAYSNATAGIMVKRPYGVVRYYDI